MQFHSLLSSFGNFPVVEAIFGIFFTNRPQSLTRCPNKMMASTWTVQTPWDSGSTNHDVERLITSPVGKMHHVNMPSNIQIFPQHRMITVELSEWLKLSLFLGKLNYYAYRLIRSWIKSNADLWISSSPDLNWLTLQVRISICFKSQDFHSFLPLVSRSWILGQIT